MKYIRLHYAAFFSSKKCRACPILSPGANYEDESGMRNKLKEWETKSIAYESMRLLAKVKEDAAKGAQWSKYQRNGKETMEL